MGVAGAPFPYYLSFVDPGSAFNLSYAVNSLAMPMVGGTTSWLGPVIGAVLLGTAQQLATVTISSELNLLIVGVILVVFVVAGARGHRRPPPAPDVGERTRDGGATAPRVEGVVKRFGGFQALGGVSSHVDARRALRADRPERLRQDHAHQLHVRHPAQRRRADLLRRARTSARCPPISGRGSASRGASRSRGPSAA